MPVVSGVAPASTVAVIVNADPLAALEGFTARVVVVVVCAPAMALDSTINNAAHRAGRGFVLRVAFTRAFAFLEPSNFPPALPEICGNPIAPGRNAVRKRDRASTHLTAATGDQLEPHVVLVEDAVWQKRGEDEAPRESLINTGISKPFDRCNELEFVFRDKPFELFMTRSPSLRRPLICVAE